MIKRKNVIVYGYNTLGTKICNILKHKDYNVIVVDFEDDNIQKAISDGFENHNLTLLNDDELLSLGIGENKIDSLFCVSNDNKNNLFVTLSARNLDKHVKIISISKTKNEAKKLSIAGATKVLNPNELGALRIDRHISQPLMLKVLDEILFSKSDLSIAEIYVDKKSLINGAYLKEISNDKKFNIIIIGIMDKELGEKFIFNTKGINHKIDEGDILVAVGKTSDIEIFKNYISGDAK